MFHSLWHEKWAELILDISEYITKEEQLVKVNNNTVFLSGRTKVLYFFYILVETHCCSKTCA